jgi:hypothetical protein
MLVCSTFWVLGPFRSDEALGREFTKFDRVNRRHLSDDFGEFVTECFVLWSWTQKVLDGVFKELSNDVQHHLKGFELIKLFKFYEITRICVSLPKVHAFFANLRPNVCADRISLKRLSIEHWTGYQTVCNIMPFNWKLTTKKINLIGMISRRCFTIFEITDNSPFRSMWCQSLVLIVLVSCFVGDQSAGKVKKLETPWRLNLKSSKSTRRQSADHFTWILVNFMCKN